MAMLYRKKYMISIYNQYDQLITVVDNVDEFAKFLRRTPFHAKHILSKLFLKKTKSFYLDKERFFVSFIED